MKLSTVAIASFLFVAAISPAKAGQIGSGSNNTFGHETYQGRNWSSGQAQTQETLNGVSRSSSAKSEFLIPDGQSVGRVNAQFGSYADSNGFSSAYCNAGVNIDPACLTSASRTDATFSKSTQSNTIFGSEGHFSGQTRTIDASSYTNF